MMLDIVRPVDTSTTAVAASMPASRNNCHGRSPGQSRSRSSSSSCCCSSAVGRRRRPGPAPHRRRRPRATSGERPGRGRAPPGRRPNTAGSTAAGDSPRRSDAPGCAGRRTPRTKVASTSSRDLPSDTSCLTLASCDALPSQFIMPQVPGGQPAAAGAHDLVGQVSFELRALDQRAGVLREHTHRRQQQAEQQQRRGGLDADPRRGEREHPLGQQRDAGAEGQHAEADPDPVDQLVDVDLDAGGLLAELESGHHDVEVLGQRPPDGDLGGRLLGPRAVDTTWPGTSCRARGRRRRAPSRGR